MTLLAPFNIAEPQIFHLPDEDATARLGGLIAPQLKPGDVIYLHGDLGMGKSALARGLIRALTTLEQEVPSPTFTLIQSYDTLSFEVLHLDLYRLTDPEEAYELGLDEARSHAVLVIEWPDRLGHLGFDDRLDIVLEVPDITNFPLAAGGRIARLTPHGGFRGS
ncbi:tRNA (adenosine(37)-N6)-threonylcarbamoyltransferase complex ATPase subunit type 1 TsaE [Asticcacaulis solisilvae]|uniref:tRNA (adenosine(37)-N6)-threonylcarbamoyltransferase complex ATPase subunit type 1 TsaE n=1 Tax=Asticcacaulis solisilvae TaxID=1217274 RepID=UPI003FD8C9CE